MTANNPESVAEDAEFARQKVAEISKEAAEHEKAIEEEADSAGMNEDESVGQARPDDEG